MKHVIDKNYPLWSLGQFARPYKFVVFGALTAMVLASSAILALPYALGLLFDQGFSVSMASSRHESFVWFALLSFAVAVFSAWRFYWVTWLGERVIADLRKRLFSRLMYLDIQQYEFLKTGELLSRLTTDTTLIQQVLTSSFSLAIRNGLQSIGALVMMFWTSVYLAGLFVILVPVLLGPFALMMRKQRRLARTSQDKLAAMGAYAGEVLHAMPVAKAFTHEAYDSQRYAEAVEDGYLFAMKRAKVRSLITIIMMLALTVAMLVVFWMGSSLLLSVPALITAGQLAQFFLYAALLLSGILAVSEVWSDVVRASAASERLIELLETQAIIPQGDLTAKDAGDKFTVDFQQVSFAYPARPKTQVLNEFSCQINCGDTVALVGGSGAGKSTVLQLLTRFYEVNQGQISLGGHNLKNYDLQQLRSLISVVPQEVVVFSGSIMDNIRYGDPEADQTCVLQAAKYALVDEFVQHLPKGYDTLVGEKGMRLSGGQRQRLAIARAFLKDAPLLLLDEATSNLDSENERLLQAVLDKLMINRTTLVVAHRWSTIKKADKIILMERGQIIAQGTHKQLMQSNKRYAELANLQLLEE